MEEKEEILYHSEVSFKNEQLDESTLPTMAFLEYSPLEKNLLKADLIWTILFFSIGILILLFLQYYIRIEWLLNFGHWILIGLIALSILSLLVVYFGFFKKSYAIREKDIIYNSGLFWRSSVAIPFNRVQHCEVAIGPIDRMFELSELKIFTAGGASSDLTIEGLTPETSNRLKDYIVNKTGIDEEE
ncbi:MAG: PH domain-containing protein [Bacteroidota bacterium]